MSTVPVRTSVKYSPVILRLHLCRRVAVMLMIASLMSPMISFGPTNRAEARARAKEPISTQFSIPPEPYILPKNADSNLAVTLLSVSARAVEMVGALLSFNSIESAPEAENVEELNAENEEAAGPESTEAFLPPPPPADVGFDFDGDGRADIGSWRPVGKHFVVKKSSGSTLGYTFGSSAAKIAPGDFDGDGKTDAGVFLNGTWTYASSSSGTGLTCSLGTTGDLPVPGDYNGNGTTDFAIYRPSTGEWKIDAGCTGNPTTISFGASTDIPVPGDYDGDSKTDIAVWRPSDGTWYINKSSGGNLFLPWGMAGDVPVIGDFDGDGLNDPAVFRPYNGMWYVKESGGNYLTYKYQSWGNFADQPVAADYDGDGKTDFAIWRPTTSEWWIMKSSDSTYYSEILGASNDVAIPSAFTKQVGGTVTPDAMAGARMAPGNATGGTNLYSRNFGWSRSLVSLPGRSGLDLNLGIGYNSLIWTKVGSEIHFDPDNTTADLVPGFRMGPPVIEPVYFSGDKNAYAYMMVGSDGSRTEFRTTSAKGTSYFPEDSTYRLLRVTSDTRYAWEPVEDITFTVFDTDGNAMEYVWVQNAFRCTQIRDRNGNYITFTYSGRFLTAITDTLGRVVTINYDAFIPVSITQSWKGDNGAGSIATHTWATFSYSTKTVATNFSVDVFGPPNDTVIKVLDKIAYSDGSFTKFEYNGYLQVQKVSNVAADSASHVLNYVSTDLDSVSGAQDDCPRFTQTKTWAENSNGGQPVVANNTAPASDTFAGPNGSESTKSVRVEVVNHPNDLYSLIHFAPSGYKEGLTLASEDCIGTDSECATRKRWTWTDWTQDNTNVAYRVNPRVIESRVGDGTNTKKTNITYHFQSGSGWSVHLPETVSVGDLTTILKTHKTVYNWSTLYTNQSRRIIGLPVETTLWEGTTSGTLMSKVTYAYDEGTLTGTDPVQNIAPTQHFTSSYGSSFNKRGNLTSVTRHDVTGATSAVTSSIKYNTAGSPVSRTDPLGRVVKLSYSDVWNDSVSRTTFAYPTTITDPAGNSSQIKYRYDIGANVWAKGPNLNQTVAGKETEREYDSLGRLLQQTVVNTGAYTRYEYPQNGVHSKVFSTLVDTNTNGPDTADEVLTESWFDGAGRIRQSRTEHPSSIGGWSATKTLYDILGRVTSQSVPTEVDNNWNPSDLDAGLWKYTLNEYDWKDRITKVTNTDGTFKTMTYEGCGCAGGESVTIEGEEITETDWQGNTTQTLGKRKQKLYSDTLGRNIKSEIFNWDGTIHSSVSNDFNGRDQVTQSRHFEGAVGSPNYQDTTMGYDGHGRPESRHVPIQAANRNTVYEYFPDDTVKKITDARGASASYTYNNRGLVETVNHAVPSNNEGLTPWTSRTDKTSSTSIKIFGGSFAADIVVNVGEMRAENGYAYTELATLSGAQLTRGTEGGQQTIAIQFTASTLLDALEDNVMKVKVANSSTGQSTPMMHLWFYGGATSIFGSGFDDTVPTATGTSFIYDDAGNRISMTDELGAVTYAYNGLSQLESETRQIAALSQSYTLGYTYELSGQLKTLTDGFNSTVTYTHNKAGQLTEVNGTNYGLTSSSFISGMKYRAWGAMSEADFGYGGNLDLTYNSRLQPTEFKVTGSVYGTPYTRGSQYSYYADGQVKKSDDLADNRFDRTYKFDQTARLKEALSGFEARGESGIETDRPYKQTYEYNAWENRTGGTQKFWRTDQSALVARQYVNDRATDTAYDADGRSLTSRMDAAGRGIEYYGRDFVGGGTTGFPSQPAFEISQKFDGNGDLVKRVETKRRDEEVNGQATVAVEFTDTYYLRSTVLGGKAVAEINAANGTKAKGKIYANGALLAEQIMCPQCNPTSWIIWREANPLTGGRNEVNSDGGGTAEERDPMGANTGTRDPWEYLDDPMYQDIIGDQQPLYLESGGNPFDPNSPYQIDGLPVSQEDFERRVGSGSVVGDVFHNGRFIGQAQLIGGFVSSSRYIHIELPDIHYDVMHDFGDGNGPQVYPQIKQGGYYFIDVTRQGTRQANYLHKLTPTQVQSLRKELVKMITPDCLVKVSQIFSEAERLAAGTPNEDKAVSSNPIEIFDEVAKQGGFYFADQFGINTSIGAIGAGTAAISISFYTFKSSSKAGAQKALAETYHVPGSRMSGYLSGTFSDVNLATASYNLGLGVKRFVNYDLATKDWLTQFPGTANIDPWNDSSSAHWSTYNHKSFEQYCK